jgi:predicted nucleotidyltransferase
MPTVTFVVDDNDEVCDVTELTPADARNFLREARGRRGADGEACTSVDHAARHFFDVASYDEPKDQELFGANILLHRLVAQGYLVKNDDSAKDTDTHALTPEGIRLCTKKFIPRINRVKADLLVAEPLRRATEVNRRGELTHHIASIHVFGSYLTDSDSLGDIDITIELERRHDDWENHNAVNQARIRASGRLSRLLALEVAPIGRATADRHGAARIDPADEHGESALGRATHSRRTAQARV